MPAISKVIIVGAGPAGLLAALLLAKRNIPVQVLESGDKLDEQPRATHYGLPALPILRESGILDEVKAQGFEPRSVCWRKLDGTRLTGTNMQVPLEPDQHMVCLPLNKLCKIILEHLERYTSNGVLWSTKVTDIGRNELHSWVEAETLEGSKRFEADYIIGCDGANSQVRRSLFGEHWDESFPGSTWNEQLVATNVYYDFEKYGWEDANLIIDPEHWFLAARIGNDGMYRVSYGEKAGYNREQLIARQPLKYELLLPGHPKPGQYKVVNVSPYRIHQRLAPKMRVGRFLLAADAAHLCNPFGGWGLTGGLVDVEGLYQCLVGIHENLTDDSILDKYNEIRRLKYQTFTDPMSSANIRLLFESNPDTVLEDSIILKNIQKGEKDIEFAKQGLLVSLKDLISTRKTITNGDTNDYTKIANDFRHDFTQYYFLKNGHIQKE